MCMREPLRSTSGLLPSRLVTPHGDRDDLVDQSVRNVTRRSTVRPAICVIPALLAVAGDLLATHAKVFKGREDFRSQAGGSTAQIAHPPTEAHGAVVEVFDVALRNVQMALSGVESPRCGQTAAGGEPLATRGGGRISRRGRDGEPEVLQEALLVAVEAFGVGALGVEPLPQA